jgi:tape measure domain-containing protein
MAEVASLNAIIGADTTGFSAALAAAEGSLRRFAGNVDAQSKAASASFSSNLNKMSAAASQLTSLGGGLTAGLTLPLAGLGIASVKAAGDIEALEKGFTATYKGSEPLQDALARVRELAKLPGLGLKEALQGATNLQAAGFSANLAARSLAAFGNALATVGKGKADLNGVGLALGQIASKGKISAEEINQLAERVPQIRGALKAAFGTADTQALNKAGISATDFVEGVTRELEKLPKVTGGINNAFENFSDSATKSLARLGARLAENLNLEATLGKAGAFIEDLANSFASLPEGTQTTIIALGGLAVAVGPVLAGIGALGAAIPALVTGLGTVGAVVGLAAGPLALLVAGVAGAAVAIVANWDDIVAYFQGPQGQIFQDLARSVSESFGIIKDAFSAFGELGEGVFSETGQLIGEVVHVIAVAVTGLLDTIVGLVRTADGLLTGDWSKAWDGAKQSVVGVAGFVAELFGYDYADLRAKLNILGDTNPAPIAQGVSVLRNAFFDLNAGLAGFVSQGPAFEASLSGIADRTDKATTSITALSEAQQKALASFNDALRLNENLSRALGQDEGVRVVGNDYAYVEGRAKALESGIMSLIRAGFGPQSAVVQNAVAELQRLKNAYDDLGRIELRLPDGVAAPKVEAPKQAFETNLDAGQFALPELLDPSIKGLTYSKQVADEAERLQEAYKTLNSAAGAGQFEALTRQTEFNTNMEMLLGTFGEGISTALGTVASSLGDAFGAIVANGASIGDGLTLVFSGILNALAGFMGQFGQQLIAIGIGKLALDTLFKGPAGGPLAIAAGIGLVALAGVAKALAKSSSAKLGSITGGGGSAASGGNTVRPNANARPEPIRIDLNLQPVEIRQKGPDLAGVLALDSYRRRRAG